MRIQEITDICKKAYLSGAVLLCCVCFMLQAGCGTAATRQGIPATYAFYPAPPDEPRFQFLLSFRSDEEIGATGKKSTFADYVLGAEAQKEKTMEVVKPYGLAIWNGKIYACDTDQNMVAVFDLANKAFSFMGGDRTGRLRKPVGIAVDEDGKKYVADTGWNRVLIYDQNDEYSGAVGDPEKMRPVDVLVVGDDVYICDFKDNEIEIWDKNTEKYKGVLGESVGEKVEVARPLSIAGDKENNFYVMESYAFQLSVFDEEGHRLRSFGKVGDSYGQFARPKGIAVDGDGRVYIVDAAFANIQVFDSEGQLLTIIGGPGGEAGQLILPAEIVVDYENVDLFKRYVHPDYDLKFLVIVSNQYGLRRINVYGFIVKKS